MHKLRKFLVIGILAPLFGTGGIGAQEAPKPPSDTDLVIADLMTQYRATGTSGNSAMAAQYERLGGSLGGSFALSVLDPGHTSLWKVRVDYLNQDDYKAAANYKYKDIFSFDISAQSLVKNSTKLALGPDLSPDDINFTDSVPAAAILQTRRTSTYFQAKLKVPSTPVTLYVKGDEQDKTGQVQQHFFDMGSDQACGACHLGSYERGMSYTTQHLKAGAIFDLGKKVSITYEHGWSQSQNNQAQPTDAYGLTQSIPGDTLPPGVPSTGPGNLVHDVLPGHHGSMDMVKCHASLPASGTLNASFSKGTSEDTFTGNVMDVVSGNADYHQSLGQHAYVGLDAHLQENVNQFTPIFNQFPNASLRRNWETARLGLHATSNIDLEIYARRNAVERSEADLFPQVYSPDNTDPLKVVPYTITNTLGTSATWKRAGIRIKAGYEWSAASTPGYETDPGLAQRASLDLTLTPSDTFIFTNSTSMLWQRHFTNIQRQGDYFTDNASLMVRPTEAWTLSFGLGYSQDDLKTDMVFGNDPAFYYAQSLVPYKATGLNTSVTSTLLFAKRWSWTLTGQQGAAHGSFSPDSNALAAPSWNAATQESLVNTPVRQLDTGLKVSLGAGFQLGCQVQYGAYRNWIQPELSGIFRAFTLGASKSW